MSTASFPPSQKFILCLVVQELADGSVHGGGSGHQVAVHAGRGPAGISRRSFLRRHGKDKRPAGHDEDGQSHMLFNMFSPH